jgi:hypothetical protein
MSTQNSENIRVMLSNISSDLGEIKESQRRLETHNSFIVKIYFMFRDPIIRIFQKITRGEFLLDDELNEMLLSKNDKVLNELENGIYQG